MGIAPLNGNAAPITSAIGGVNPNGRTPTDPALHGALNYARSWAQRNPTHKVIVVLATDGGPNCNESLNPATCTCSVRGGCTAQTCLDDVRTLAAIRAHSTHLVNQTEPAMVAEREYLESFVKAEEVFWPIKP